MLCGSPVIADKKNPDILLTSPVSGTVKALVRGEKRKCWQSSSRRTTNRSASTSASRIPPPWMWERITAALLERSLALDHPAPLRHRRRPGGQAVQHLRFSLLIRRPWQPTETSARVGGQEHPGRNQRPLKAHRRRSACILRRRRRPASELRKLSGVHAHFFKGKHPAGNVGVQISHIRPIRKGDTVWTVSLLGLAAIGKLFTKGRYDVRRKVAVCGPMYRAVLCRDSSGHAHERACGILRQQRPPRPAS